MSGVRPSHRPPAFALRASARQAGGLTQTCSQSEGCRAEVAQQRRRTMRQPASQSEPLEIIRHVHFALRDCRAVVQAAPGRAGRDPRQGNAYAEPRRSSPTRCSMPRLYPDMYTLKRQVRRPATSPSCALAASPASRRRARRQREDVCRPEEAHCRNDGRDRQRHAGADGRRGGQAVLIKAGPRELHFSGRDYLLHFALPNFLFHCATAYGILRHNGLEIGKRDFMRRMQPAQ